MSYGHADHAFLEITAAAIIAANSTSWTKAGSLPDCLALLCFNDLDGGFKLWFSDKQGATAPANSVAEHYKLASGEPLFVNYKNIGHIFGSCDVYVKALAVDPTAGSFRMTGIKVAPRAFKG